MKLSLNIAAHYASVWFEETKKNNCLEETYRDVLLLKKLMKDNPNIVELLKNPGIPSEKKIDFFTTVFSSHVQKLTSTFFSILIHKKRGRCFGLILRQFLEKYNTHHHIQVAHVITASRLPNDLLASIEHIVTNLKGCKSVLLKERIDPTLLGGFVLKVGDQQLDNSLVAKLTLLKKKFTASG